MVFLPRDANERRTCETMFENIVVEEGQKFLGWRVVPTNNASPGGDGPGERAVRPAGLHPAQPQAGRRHGLRAQALRHPQAGRTGHPLQRRCKGGHWFYISSLSCRTLVYKGMLLTEQMDEYYPDLTQPGDGERAGAGPFPFQHQHLSQLGPRPSLPLHRPQRRDQHPARQHQLDARPPGHVPERPLRRRPARNCCRSSTRTAAIRPCSTTAWNCWCWPGARCRTP